MNGMLIDSSEERIICHLNVYLENYTQYVRFICFYCSCESSSNGFCAVTSFILLRLIFRMTSQRINSIINELKLLLRIYWFHCSGNAGMNLHLLCRLLVVGLVLKWLPLVF